MTHPGFHVCSYHAKNKQKSLHRHKYIQINYVNKGSGYHIINNSKIDIYKGDIFIIPPYVPHSIISENDSKMEIVEFEFSPDFILPSQTNVEEAKSYLEFAFLEPFMVTEEQVKPRFKLSEELQIEIEEILNEALLEFENKAPGYMLVVKSLLLKLLVITGRAYTEDIEGTETEEILNKYKSVVAASFEYINDNFMKYITLKDVDSYVNYYR